jgi:hypothetical protein
MTREQQQLIDQTADYTMEHQRMPAGGGDKLTEAFGGDTALAMKSLLEALGERGFTGGMVVRVKDKPDPETN